MQTFQCIVYTWRHGTSLVIRWADRQNQSSHRTVHHYRRHFDVPRWIHPLTELGLPISITIDLRAPAGTVNKSDGYIIGQIAGSWITWRRVTKTKLPCVYHYQHYCTKILYRRLPELPESMLSSKKEEKSAISWLFIQPVNNQKQSTATR